VARKGFSGRKVSKGLAIGALAATAVAGVGFATTGAANAATTPSWSSAGPAAVSGAVSATASVQFGGTKTAEWAFVTTAYISGNKGYPAVYSRVNAAQWAKSTLPGSAPGETFVSATAISNTNVLAFSNLPNGTGREWQFNGSTWKVIKTFSATIGNASVTSASNVWVAGTIGGTQLGVWHYNGSTWTKLASTLHGVQGLSASSAWAYTGSTVAQYNGKAWTGTNLATLIGGSAPRITDVYDTDGTTYAVADNGGTSEILAYNGKGWAKVGQAASADPRPSAVSADGDGGIWFLANAPGSGASKAVHYTRSVKTTTVSELPGSVMSITRVDQTNELAGGSIPSGKLNPSTYAEVEYYN